MVHGVGYVGVVTVSVLVVDDGYGIGDERKMVCMEEKKWVSRCGGVVVETAQGELWVADMESGVVISEVFAWEWT